MDKTDENINDERHLIDEPLFSTEEEYLLWHKEEQRLRSYDYMTAEELFNEYVRKIGEPIPMMCVMGDEILYGKFHGNDWEVYQYCLKHNVKWEEVLNFKFDPTVLY